MAGSDELDNEENERRSPGSFFMEFEKREEFNVEELGVEGLSDESRLLEADFFGDGVGRVYGWNEVLAMVRSLRCKRCERLPGSKLVSRETTRGKQAAPY